MRFSRLALAALAAAASPLVPLACGHSGATGSAGAGGAGAGAGGGAGGSSTAMTSTGSVQFPDQSNCTTGQDCGDGGVCAGNVCCTAALACGEHCCAGGEVCSFEACVTPGAPCHDPTDCPAGQYCEYSLGTQTDGGALEAGCSGAGAELNGLCLPRPPICAADAGTPDAGALSCLERCEYRPAAASFDPVVRYAWGGQITAPFASDVMMSPIVVPLEDTNCDGKINAADIPAILFTSFSDGAYTSNGTLHAMEVLGGQIVERWSVPGAVSAAGQLAGGKLASGVPFVVGCGAEGAAHAFRGDGSVLWVSPVVGCGTPSIADLGQTGAPDVIVDGAILDGATGAVKATFTPGLDGPFVVSDIDGDGKLDIVTNARGYHADGTMFVDTGMASGGFPGIGDFDLDGKPEVVVDYNAHALSLWRFDAQAPNKFAVVRAPIDINGPIPLSHCPVGSAGNTKGGGPPTVADFDGDGVPDIGLAGGVGYAAFSGKKLMDPAVAGPSAILWTSPTTDCSSAATGSAVFDFTGDGKAQVIYSDENHLRIYDGATGTVLASFCNTTGTLIEYPVVADVDNDGHAEIVVVSNAYASGNAEYACFDGTGNAQSGVRVFGDSKNSWVRTRSIWNEHAYHITNVGDDGTIPLKEAPNWTQPGLDNFRQNKQPGAEFAAPDAVIALAPACGSAYGLVATVRNIGEAALPAGVAVGFYEGAPPAGKKLGAGATVAPLYPAQSERVTLVVDHPDPALVSGHTPVYAVVDDTMTPHPSWHECRTDNDTSPAVTSACPMSH